MKPLSMKPLLINPHLPMKPFPMRSVLQAVEQGPILNRLQRTGRFLYEVVCAFVIHDLDGLLQRHMRKAAAGFAKLTD